ncbi:MAG: response regulator, partial [Deltaproteobacteria bacterium]|nr:response regulator [Deltaproteobacteria bacterium]
MKNILIVDDEKSICQSLKGILEDEGFQTSFAATGEKCLEIIQEENPDLILLDIWMPGIDGLETLKKVKQIRPQQLVIMMSGHGSIETAVKATRLGAFDFIEKPLSLEKVLLSIQNAIKISQLVAENKALKEKIGRDYQMIGESPVIDQLKQQIKLA